MSWKHREHEEHDDHVEHIDEKWLISYSDMMTLLFGLFVMLFSIASQYQGNFQEQLQKISKETFNQEQQVKLVPPPAPPKPVEDIAKIKEELDALRVQVKNLHDQLALSETEKESLKRKLAESQKNEAQLRQDLEEALAKLKKMAELQKKSKPTDEAALRAKLIEDEALIAKLKNELAEQSKKLNALAENEKTEKAQKQRQIASISEEQNKVKNLEQTNSQLMQKQKDLEQQIESMKKETESQAQFLFVIIKWTSEKHDLDLSVTDPTGKTFNFKSRKFDGHPGEFTLDSRSGPGAEIWQTSKIIPGVYKISWKLYNSYGNDKPVQFSGFISSSRGRVLIPESTFEAKVGAQKTIQVKIDSKGNLKEL